MNIKITGMTCGHCVKAVTEALAKVPGVKEVKDVSLKDGIARVEGTPDPQQLIAAVKEEGYAATLL
jgi:copper chaperone